jgi:hypothetical protein
VPYSKPFRPCEFRVCSVWGEIKSV